MADVTSGWNWVVAYIYAMHFILMTMTTIGYGDITPRNPMEAVFTLFIMLICSALFGYTLNCINQILDDLKRGKANYSRMRHIVGNYMVKKHIS